MDEDNNTVKHENEVVARGKNSRLGRWVFLVVVLVVVIGGIILIAANTGNSNSTNNAQLAKVQAAEVSITGKGFVPATITIKTGQAVAWTNNDVTDHIVASDPYPNDNGLPGFSSQQDIKPGDGYSYTFDKPGTYTYHDDLNPNSFLGTVVVD